MAEKNIPQFEDLEQQIQGSENVMRANQQLMGTIQQPFAEGSTASYLGMAGKQIKEIGNVVQKAFNAQANKNYIESASKIHDINNEYHLQLEELSQQDPTIENIKQIKSLQQSHQQALEKENQNFSNTIANAVTRSEDKISNLKQTKTRYSNVFNKQADNYLSEMTSMRMQHDLYTKVSDMTNAVNSGDFSNANLIHNETIEHFNLLANTTDANGKLIFNDNQRTELYKKIVVPYLNDIIYNSTGIGKLNLLKTVKIWGAEKNKNITGVNRELYDATLKEVEREANNMLLKENSENIADFSVGDRRQIDFSSLGINQPPYSIFDSNYYNYLNKKIDQHPDLLPEVKQKLLTQINSAEKHYLKEKKEGVVNMEGQAIPFNNDFSKSEAVNTDIAKKIAKYNGGVVDQQEVRNQTEKIIENAKKDPGQTFLSMTNDKNIFKSQEMQIQHGYNPRLPNEMIRSSMIKNFVDENTGQIKVRALETFISDLSDVSNNDPLSDHAKLILSDTIGFDPVQMPKFDESIRNPKNIQNIRTAFGNSLIHWAETPEGKLFLSNSKMDINDIATLGLQAQGIDVSLAYTDHLKQRQEGGRDTNFLRNSLTFFSTFGAGPKTEKEIENFKKDREINKNVDFIKQSNSQYTDYILNTGGYNIFNNHKKLDNEKMKIFIADTSKYTSEPKKIESDFFLLNERLVNKISENKNINNLISSMGIQLGVHKAVLRNTNQDNVFELTVPVNGRLTSIPENPIYITIPKKDGKIDTEVVNNYNMELVEKKIPGGYTYVFQYPGEEKIDIIPAEPLHKPIERIQPKLKKLSSKNTIKTFKPAK